MVCSHVNAGSVTFLQHARLVLHYNITTGMKLVGCTLQRLAGDVSVEVLHYNIALEWYFFWLVGCASINGFSFCLVELLSLL